MSPQEDGLDEVGALLEKYEQFLAGKAQGTKKAYLRTVHHLVGWLAQLPGNEEQFQPSSARSCCGWSSKQQLGGLIEDLTFHDLHYDFAQRARAAGWSLAEVASYLGYVPQNGTPALHTTVGSPQVSREQVQRTQRHQRVDGVSQVGLCLFAILNASQRLRL